MKTILLYLSFFIIPFTYACSSSSSCKWTVCYTTYPEFSPRPASGTCVVQQSVGVNSIETYSKGGGCPGNQGCSEPVRYRTWCSCQEIYSCWWSEWNQWSGNINHNTCGYQYRYRVTNKVFKYTEKPNCHGSITGCSKDIENESRTWCSCKKVASCVPSEWSSWSPSPNPNTCIKQKRSRDKIATFIYENQETNCNGVNDRCDVGYLEDERVLCNCPYKECTEGEWTNWEIHLWKDNCPTERRLKYYRFDEKYRFAYDNCDSVGPKVCPDPVGHVREREIACPPLPLEQHSVHNDVCNGVSSKCQSICTISCKNGFSLSGNRYITCLGDGNWSGLPGKCEDVEPPNIICPVLSSEIFNLPNKNYSIIDLPEATATDNSRNLPKITMDKISPLKVFVGSPFSVTYTATDSSGNQRSCVVNFLVSDNEPPMITHCPSDILLETGVFPHQLFWEEPTFYDNVDGLHLVVHPSHQIGSYFPRGKHTIVYSARDQSFNKVHCSFSVQLDFKSCPLYDPPKNGALNCNIKKNGIVETHICTVACKSDHWFLQSEDLPPLYNFYVCGEDEQWRGQNEITSLNPVFFVPIQKGVKPWPDCSIGEIPELFKTNFQVYAGKCRDEVQQLQLKQAFINAMTNDVVIDNLFCKISADHCTINNLEITCSSNSYSVENMIIKFTLNGRGNLPVFKKSIQDSIAALKLTLNEKVFKEDIIDVKDFMLFEEVTCKDGYELIVVNASSVKDEVNSDVEKNNLRCIQCTKGMYFDKISSKCKVCEIGTYQPSEGQMSCNKCPESYSTIENGAYSHSLCKAICKPGTYSSNGMENCIACPISTYQPFNKSSECIPCPFGTISANVGAVSIADCLPTKIEVVMRSEGCGDPNISYGCGLSTIHVNGIQYSLMKRGMNFVVLDAYTGAFVKSESFDWHGDHQACDKTYEWIKQLKNECIVLAAVQDEATFNAYDKCFQSLELLGGKHPFQNEYRSSFAMIGYKGLHSVTWVHQERSGYGKGPTLVTKSISLLSV
ncbi:sushi, von Willebrand factor type A, EGF and pentraxin domain-containing protein 1 isoform X1 [Hydra vulgaris]|uniref:sushi, von Willebrand factor type A, EGF and pentraxin domain-containing protein 1 isoform X1 n=1 Tax=Hydra vulgaris TaxID=6087 RepID=UPI001F5FE92A|nr:sushi, von Willebrand factor type A, EGF and pentraxin domain-containing protein 1 [Hydra vulgaris]